jgi:hypothetical protein
MDYTYLDYFNYYLKEYLNELINTFPETRDPLLSNYRLLLENRDDKNDFYAKCFYTKINNYLVDIAKRNIELFVHPGKIFIEGIDLHFIWNNSNANEQTHTAIWKYLQILMILGRKIIPNHKEIVELLQKVSLGDVNIPAKVEQTLSKEEKDESEAPGVFGLGDIASSLSSLGSLASGLGLGGTGSGGAGGGGAGEGISSLFSGITQMFSNPEFTNAMSQLSQNMAANMNSSPTTDSEEQSTNDTTQSHTIDEQDDKTPTAAEHSGTQCPPMNETGSAGIPGFNNGTQSTGTTHTPQTPQPPQLFNNQLFGDLAKELTETFNLEEMEKQGKPANIGEAIGKFMTGDNPAKLMGLVGKFGAKLQQEVQRGSINPAELLQQTMGAMGPGMANMMQNMGANPQMRQMAQKQSTRDRLRAKLDKRNGDKQ